MGIVNTFWIAVVIISIIILVVFMYLLSEGKSYKEYNATIGIIAGFFIFAFSVQRIMSAYDDDSGLRTQISKLQKTNEMLTSDLNKVRDNLSETQHKLTDSVLNNTNAANATK